HGKITKKIIKETAEDIKKIIDSNKKMKPEGNTWDKVLETTEKIEPFINAAIAAILTIIARPLTNVLLSMVLGDEKDYMYASSHSIASGILGLIFPLLFINPLSKGYDLVRNNANKYLKDMPNEEYIKLILKRHPQTDPKTLIDAEGNKNPFEKVMDIHGNPSSPDIKDVMKVPLPKHLSELPKVILEKYFPNIDAEKSALKSANEWIDKAGNKTSLPDTLDDLFICLEKEGKKGKNSQSYFPLRYIKEDLLKELFPDLDIASTKGADGKRLSLSHWKNINGQAYNLDKDFLYYSNIECTDKFIPLITGEMRTDVERKSFFHKSKKIDKYICYQTNGKPGELGTPITQDMIEAERANAVHNKLGQWLGDIVLAVPRAILTIMLIPIILKKVFHIEKKKPAEKQEVQQINNEIEVKDTENTAEKQLAFKGKKPSKISDFLARTYGKAIYKSKAIRKFAEWFAPKDTSNATKHFQVLGALATSATYAVSTIKSPNFDKDNATTLAVNQTLGWVAPTLLGYITDKAIQERTKQWEFNYCNKRKKAIELSKLSNEEKQKLLKGLNKSQKGFRTFAGMVTFTLMYRYLAPVLITPLANKIGAAINKSKKEKEEQKVKLATA
ncbi:MAG: hypothetical protein MJ231_03460, partial [bacterium]|nr:hypothetical protein [bacterium]